MWILKRKKKRKKLGVHGGKTEKNTIAGLALAPTKLREKITVLGFQNAENQKNKSLNIFCKSLVI